MKPQIITTFLLMLTAFAGVTNCKTIETRIEIDKNPAEVWQEFKDFEKYGNWNPFIKEIRRIDKDTLQITLETGDGETMVFEPKVLKNEPDHYVWRGRFLMPGIFTGEHEFKVTPHPEKEGVAVFLHNERFSGILVPFFNFKNTEKGFRKMNTALKERVESIRQKP